MNKYDQNIDKQIMVLRTLTMYCRHKSEGFVYPFQMQISDKLFETTDNGKTYDNLPLRFGSGLVGQVLRPFVIWNWPKKHYGGLKGIDGLEQFLINNPILGESHNS